MGGTREHVLAADVVLADGRRVRLERGNSIETPLKFADGSSIEFPAIRYESPRCKNAAGYYVQPGMDWLDLFIGSDGTLGVFVSIQLQLARRPAEFISGVLFFSDEESCWNLAARLRGEPPKGLAPCALEYFDHNSLVRLKPKYPNIPDRAQAALFFEQDVAEREDVETCLTNWFEFLEHEEVLLDDSWMAQNASDAEKFHEFRHQIPVLINEENSRLQRVKIGTDMAVSDDHFMAMMEFYRRTLVDSGLDHVVFGHLGDNHLHINLLPGKQQMDRAQAVYDQLLTQILKWGGTVSAEHGIGKLKKMQFARMVGPQAVQELKRIKQRLDPRGILGAGNIL